MYLRPARAKAGPLLLAMLLPLGCTSPPPESASPSGSSGEAAETTTNAPQTGGASTTSSTTAAPGSTTAPSTSGDTSEGTADASTSGTSGDTDSTPSKTATPDGLWELFEFVGEPAEVTGLPRIFLGSDSRFFVTPERIEFNAGIEVASTGPWGQGTPSIPFDRISLGSFADKPCAIHTVRVENAFGVPDTVHDPAVLLPQDPDDLSAYGGTRAGQAFAWDHSQTNGTWTRVYMFLTAHRGADDGGKLFSAMLGRGIAGEGNFQFEPEESHDSTDGAMITVMAPRLNSADAIKEHTFGTLFRHFSPGATEAHMTFGQPSRIDNTPRVLGTWAAVDLFWKMNSADQNDGWHVLRVSWVEDGDLQSIVYDMRTDQQYVLSDPASSLRAAGLQWRLMHGGTPTDPEAEPLIDYEEGFGGTWIYAVDLPDTPPRGTPLPPEVE